MATFIRLKSRHGNADIIMQVEQITSISDMQSDKILAGKPEWRFTCIVCGGRNYEVKETESEILKKIGINI